MPISSDDLASFEETLRAAGIRATNQRRVIYGEVLACRTHPDAEAVFSAVRARLPSVSLDTVYRTLWMLQDLGLVAALGPRGGGTRFDGNPERHHHFVCRRCGSVTDFTDRHLDSIQAPASISGLGDIRQARVEFQGICASCLAGREHQPSSTEEGAHE